MEYTARCPAVIIFTSTVLQGPSFRVNGHHVSWQKWDFRIGFNGREGLVLYNLSYTDEDQAGRRRPVIHRASIVEMCVPYGDPRYTCNQPSACLLGATPSKIARKRPRFNVD